MNKSNSTISTPQSSTTSAHASDLMKVEEAAQYLRIGRTHCYELIRSGTLPAIQLGRLILVSRRKLDMWLDEGGTKAK